MIDEKGKFILFLRMATVLLATVCANHSTFAAIEKKLIPFWDDHEAASLIDLDHSAFEQILQKYVVSDHPSGIARFDYDSVSDADFSKLSDYLDYLQLMEPRQLSLAEAKAYWLNLHNAATLHMVIETYMDGSVTKVKARGLSARKWRRNIITIAEQKLSLDDILNGVIRPMYNDRRIHYAVFFCTLGGPDMPTTVFNGENNEELLDRFEAEFLSKSRALRIDSGELVVSQMFEDYDTDFATDKFNLISYFKEKAPEPLAETLSPALKVSFEYDWSLNDL